MSASAATDLELLSQPATGEGEDDAGSDDSDSPIEGQHSGGSGESGDDPEPPPP